MPANERSLLARAKSRADQYATPILLSILGTGVLALVWIIGTSTRPVFWFSTWMLVSAAVGPGIGWLLERSSRG